MSIATLSNNLVIGLFTLWDLHRYLCAGGFAQLLKQAMIILAKPNSTNVSSSLVIEISYAEITFGQYIP